MEAKIKNLRILAGISGLLIIIFMVVALFQPQTREEMTIFPEQVSYYFNENWTLVSLDTSKLSKVELEDRNKIQKLFENALADGKYQKVSLPYTGKISTDNLLIFKNILQEEYTNQMISFSSTDAIVRVVLNGEVIYQYGFEENLSEKLSEKKENLVEIPYIFGEAELQIELISSNPGANTWQYRN